jgi:hypothetical protein
MNLEKALGIYAEELQFRGCARSHIASVQNRIGRFVAGRGEGLVTAWEVDQVLAFRVPTISQLLIWGAVAVVDLSQIRLTRAH